MKLPRADRAAIPRSKIVDYLLSFTHLYGRSKARFFARHGFRVEEWQVLDQELRRHAMKNDVKEIVQTPFGDKFVIHGPLQTPGDKTPGLCSVWFIEKGEETPRFVTAYPLERRRK